LATTEIESNGTVAANTAGLKLSSLAASNPSCTADSQSQGLGAEEGFGADSSSAWALQQPVDSGAATGFCDSHAHNGLAKTNIMHTANTLWHQTFISKKNTMFGCRCQNRVRHHGLPKPSPPYLKTGHHALDAA
jgi:hypothetical protein